MFLSIFMSEEPLHIQFPASKAVSLLFTSLFLHRRDIWCIEWEVMETFVCFCFPISSVTSASEKSYLVCDLVVCKINAIYLQFLKSFDIESLQISEVFRWFWRLSADREAFLSLHSNTWAVCYPLLQHRLFTALFSVLYSSVVDAQNSQCDPSCPHALRTV